MVLFVINLVISAIIVNAVQKLYMKIIGASAMFYDGKKKIGWIIVVAVLLTAVGL